ncbi:MULTISPECIES: DUF4406 domain-containing protein [unclassified Treponema]|uniref:DUF4406 domain-containing protein n=1 Tax=unclassified Treponema TaxID=2638727 RepID=UPI0020A291C7|nr:MULTISPECIES: DUF4406 domain-containing protein [unclassified Treponema]UTC65992.1 DUF4406 domain-containing protein [Treponema sp. OMZ 789]UTC68722.1 DUF4406 domain-containing protein [Treponema sp. OMZ 790]UTC71452.1 DUF4406 domain-containing protein [Treponema sp. OMZ 791]
MKQLYLCGAISNNPHYKQDFEEAGTRLIEAGYSVVSPVMFCNEKWSWKKCIRKCIEVMVRNKNLAIALIENDYKSEGRTLELIIARILDLEIKTVSE